MAKKKYIINSALAGGTQWAKIRKIAIFIVCNFF